MLNDIHKHLEAGDLSFIIGAGFSKNISSKFPLWGDLLANIIEELYPTCKSKNKHTQHNRVQQIIAEKGYLAIASEYVRRKGYHEAIDLYIEQRMPYLVARVDGGYDLFINGRVVDSNPSLDCHRKLLSLRAKHIFTFNYDNTLDILAEVNASADLLKKQTEAEHTENEYKTFKEKYINLYAALNKKVRLNIPSDGTISSDDNYEPNYSFINSLVEKSCLSLQTFNNTCDIGKLHEENLNIIDTEIAKQTSLKNYFRECRSDLYQLITNAHQISLTDDCNNIYKLHGNLRVDDSVPYEFDGDKHMQYVITEEDYKEYLRKHEAFVNLMRISLLKGAFCLIGFSGDDPNFMAWINWVKDILDTGDVSSSNSRAIYYINSGETPLDESKQLLLKNHYIEIVNLFEYFDEKTHEGRMVAFFNEIKRDNELYDGYESSWRRIDIQRDNICITNDLTKDSETRAHTERFWGE